MAKKQQNTGPVNPGRPLQPNWQHYQLSQLQSHNPGEPSQTWQAPRAAQEAHAFEYSACTALGAGWGAVGSPEQARGNPPGTGPIPTGATGLYPRPKGKK